MTRRALTETVQLIELWQVYENSYGVRAERIRLFLAWRAFKWDLAAALANLVSACHLPARWRDVLTPDATWL